MNKRVMIDVSNINLSFVAGDEKIHVLNNVSFKLYENTLNIIYGQSGSGKSTLLNVLTGLQKPSVGKVLFNGKDIYALDSDQLAHFRANDIGIVYQQNSWVKSLNVVENVSLPLYFSNYDRSSAEKIAIKSLDVVGMSSFAKKSPMLMSGGEQQRVAMARALINNPMLIVADEPTGNLDSRNGDMIMNLLRHCKDNLNRTVILVTHNMEYIPYADHLIRIEDGKVFETQGSDIMAVSKSIMDGIRGRIESIAREHYHDKKI